MRAFLLFFTFCFSVSPIMADTSDTFNAVYGQDEDLLHSDLNQSLDQQLQIIEERVKQIDPEIVEKYANDGKYEKIYNYQHFLANRVYETKAEQFLNRLQEHAKSKGYKVTKASEGIDDTYILELPTYMKSPECYENGDIRDIRKCEYPKDYDFSLLSISESEIFFMLDNMETIYSYFVIRDGSGSEIGDESKDVESGEFMLELSETKLSHKEYLDFENRHIYCNWGAEIPYAKESNKCSKNSILTKKCAEIMQLSMEAYDECLGEYIYLPATDVKSVIHNFLYDSQRNSIK